MEVTNENFEAALTQLEAILPTASFVAIDEEMTGIRVDKSTDPTGGDNGQSRYQKMARVASHFNIMQFGVCVFHKEESGSYIARPFNFYIFPEENSGVVVSMGSNTAAFHRTHKFDFNKWVYGGIPFVHQARYDAMAAHAATTPAKEQQSDR